MNGPFLARREFDQLEFLCQIRRMTSVPPNALLVIAILAAVVSIALLMRSFKRSPKFGTGRGKPSHYQVFKNTGNGAPAVNTSPSVASEMQRILYASFQKKRLMNREEYGLFVRLEKLINSNTEGMRLFSQVPLGEILRSNDSDAFFCINSKRCDFVVIDRNGEALVALEYHGSGHFQGNSSMRDEVKRLALQKASIPTIEVLIGYQWPEVERQLRKELGVGLRSIS